MTRRARRRRLGVGLVAFGATGLVLALATAALLLGSLAAINDAASGFQRQRAEVVAMLGPAAEALDDAATGAANAGTSLGATRDAAGRAATLTARLASSFDSLAALGAFELFGARPFGAVAGQFVEVGAEARLVSVDLGAAAVAMDRNIADSQAVASKLRELVTRLEELGDSLAEPAEPERATAAATLPIVTAAFLLTGLLLWIALLALASLWLGARMLRTVPDSRRWAVGA